MMTFPLPVRSAEQLLQGTLRGPLQATPYGVYRVLGVGAKRGVRLATRRDSLRSPWVAQLRGKLEADGVQTRLVGQVGAPWSAKAITVAWTTLILLLLVTGTATGVADRSAEEVMECIGLCAVGIVIVHGFVVAGGRSRSAEIAYLKYWLADRLA